ncbi:N-acyl-D-amino-acid deacylase family protein [Sphingomonas profundi]|uniref:N-acyl-D-amino-acid deacylase family protein n=1 Tax=Alterirhizorhabdus profundi TaxID=2681549 RepID=UPI0012E8AB52|nr:amidohydrolase family protein [Sphingomonas profundi]
MEHDLIIRNGTVADGSGGALYVADVALRGERIVAVGKVAGRAPREIDAMGKLVTPGFVDIHTHYDGQVIWENRLHPSSGHGVTTVVMGNCGVGFAPCRAQDRARLVRLMEGVEDIPDVVLTEGLSWAWESYPDYLDAVEARPHDINMASYLPHSALRVFVMGERAAAGEDATPEDRARMADITREAIRAGAMGVSTSRTLFHRSSDGGLVPTLDAGIDELHALGAALQAEGRGILQIANDYKGNTDIDGEFALMARVARETGRPLTLPMAQVHSDPQAWRHILKLVSDANAQGLTVTAQALPRGIGLLYGLELSMHPFVFTEAYRAIASLPLRDRLARMRDPAVRREIIAGDPGDPAAPLMGFVRRFDNMYEMSDPLDYEPCAETSVAARAQRLGVPPEALAYDLLLNRSDQAAFFMPFANYADGNLDVALELFRHQHVVPGLGDGGAHYGVICDASYPTFLLTHWTRDRQRGERIGVAEAVKAMARDTALMVGLEDRGLIAPGYRADINVIDYDRLALHAPTIAFDLPANGRRLTQRADGYVATIVNGEIVYSNGAPTGALPGRLIRGPQPAPAQAIPDAAAEA